MSADVRAPAEPKEVAAGTLCRGGIAFGRKGYVGRLFIDSRPYIVCIERGEPLPGNKAVETVNFHAWRDPELWCELVDETGALRAK